MRAAALAAVCAVLIVGPLVGAWTLVVWTEALAIGVLAGLAVFAIGDR
jgi:hypothetical protein